MLGCLPTRWGGFITSAHASNYNCENPPVDEPDGDGDECTNYQPAPTANNGNSCDGDTNGSNLTCGNPINFATGNKYETELDYRGGGPFPLVLVRAYNSLDIGGSTFGTKWRGSYRQSISQPSSGVAIVTRDDGRMITFTSSGSGWVSTTSVNTKLFKTASGWIYQTVQDEMETYNANGQLLSIANRAGLLQSLNYDANGYLISVVDPFGRKVSFVYSNRLVSQMTTPRGDVYTYGYSGPRI
jgi:YD repeat-containing protein